jgi:hypothetical protein
MANLQSINQDKTLQQVFSEVINSIKVSLHCVKIGEIVEFNKENQTAKVRVLHIIDENYNTRQEKQIEYPILGDVPVVIMGGGGTYISHPIAAGDQCLLLFCDYMIDNWWVTGEAQPSIVPRKHDISDAIAIVGLNATPKAIQDYSDYLRLQYSSESSIVIGEQIDVNNETINLNGNTTNSGTMEVVGDVAMDANATVANDLTAVSLNATSAATGSFRSSDNKTVTVVNGIVTSIA